MIEQVNKNYDFKKSEKDVVEFWKKHNVFRKTVERNPIEKENFVFYDGPPTANGKPHIGHVLTRVIKDVIPRYKTMKGYHVERKAGWDTHGLPVELEVEKQINSSGKEDVEKFGIDNFIAECRKNVWIYKDLWEKMSERIGFWCDFDSPYITYDNNYIESVWWAFKELDSKNLLFKGHKVIPYCPRCSTALSSHEVAQGYEDIDTRSVFVKFTSIDEDNTYFIAWTTTPWTLLSNVALCVNPEASYSKIQVGDEFYYLAEECIKNLFEDYIVVDTFKGAELEGKEYAPLFPYAKETFKEKAYYIANDGYVTLESGSGIVHIAPAFGEDDARVGRNYKLPFVNLVDEAGCFVQGCDGYTGRNVMDCNDDIIEELFQKGMSVKVLKISHSYPHCWRCHNPLIYYARSSWFIGMESQREKLIENNRSVNWFPDNFKEGRMGNFVANVIDWAVSRDRYWGTPLPIWICNDCGHYHVIGSISELVKHTGANSDVDLHKPTVDDLTMECQKCGSTMKRTPEVCDCWIDSGAMPFAQFHYPFENQDIFKRQFPADFISEGSDQSRGWFYALQALSTALFDTTPYKNCIALGLVNDENGIKMSKHLGNVVDPWEVLDEFGADATRLYFCIANAPWVSTSFNKSILKQFQNKFLGTLWSSFYFYHLYSEIDGFDPTKYSFNECNLNVIDKWILSKLNTLIKKTSDELDGYHIFETARAQNKFVDDLSNWYIRRNRRRFFKNSMDEDKLTAYMTLHTVLVSLSKIIAPILPFVSEVLYNQLVCKHDETAPISVHLTDYPEFDESAQDIQLEGMMDEVCRIVEIGRKLREINSLRVKQPLSECFVCFEKLVELDNEMLDIISEELNIDNVRMVDSLKSVLVYELKPQLKTLGSKYKSLLPKIREYLVNGDGNAVMADIEVNGVHKTVIDGKEVEFTLEDLIVKEGTKKGYALEKNYGMTVVINTVLTEDLKARGYVREFISRVQNLRKSENFNVTDRIKVAFYTDAKLADIILKNKDIISKEILANDLIYVESSEDITKWELDGYEMSTRIEKV